ncbi:CBP80/20-dependent translation initiation factor [Oryzias melastigma]|uniref:CBP80/20-dependent translation initiation factor n=1 Tax=Oryzias melastigma TaxID=30732 RepID=A0A834BT73_ORYME|nr:CBP80/20-dependent translation initiation factor [Oryzias melastigma]
MENSSVASASSEAGSTRSQEIEELERFIDSYVLEYQVQGLLEDKADGEQDLDSGGKMPQWTDDCFDKRDGSWTSSQGRGSSKPDEWDHSSNGSTGSRPSSGSRHGSGSRSGSRGRNNQFKAPAKNGNKDGSFDILGTDIWAANTMDSRGGAGWDVQPEKLDFSHFHRKHLRGTPKHLPHIDREGMNKNKFVEDDGIDMNDIERFLPHLRSVFPPFPNEAEIAHTKKLFRRRRNDRRDRTQQQYPNQPQQTLTEPAENRHSRPPRQYQGGPRPAGPSHGYSQNRHHNQKGQGPANATWEKGAPPRATKDTENVKVDEKQIRPLKQNDSSRSTNDSARPDSTHSTEPLPDLIVTKECPTLRPAGKTSEGQPELPKVSLLQSSKERLRGRLKDKEEAHMQKSESGSQSLDRLVDLLNNMRSNSSGVEQQLASFMEEAQCSARSEESLAQVVSTIYLKAVSDRSFAATAAKLCDKMALFMVEGTKFRSLLLNMLQKDFCRREEIQQSDVELWLGFITFLCEVFGTMRSSSGEPFRVLVCPIYTCLREVSKHID